MNQHSVVPGFQDGLVSQVPAGGLALGLGLTNECNLSCSFCYRDPARVDRLSLEQVRSTMASLPVRSVNLGTRRKWNAPGVPRNSWRSFELFFASEAYHRTSNGHKASRCLPDEELRAFHDIEFSLWIDSSWK